MILSFWQDTIFIQKGIDIRRLPILNKTGQAGNYLQEFCQHQHNQHERKVGKGAKHKP
jgi:hypothetical protein